MEQSLLDSLNKAGWSAAENREKIRLFCVIPDEGVVKSETYQKLVKGIKD